MLTLIHQRWLKILLSASMLLILPMPVIGQNESNDVLAYVVNSFDGETSLKLYDPQNRESKSIFAMLPYGGVHYFSFSSDGRIAFSSMDEGNAEIYLVETLPTNQSSINISQNPATNDYPLAWSPDGRYLAFASYHEGKDTLINIWDGASTINVSPDNLDGVVQKTYEAIWSPDGRLAITVSYGSFIDSEIYLWDGSNTTNLSQNPDGEDHAPSWNTNGQLAFVSARDGNYDIFVWDGISLKNGSPDINTLTNPSPELTGYYSFPTWTNKGLLAFIGFGSQDKNSQVYVWDGQTATNISQNPTLHNGMPVWNAEGEWAFSTYFSSQQLLYVRDAKNHTLLTTEGQYDPAWSSDGYLIFCKRGERGWVLSLWDGQQIAEVAQGRDIQAQWQGGSGVHCSSG